MTQEAKIEKRKWPARLGFAVGNGLIEMLKPLCEENRICVAGSLRRGREQAGDVEILYVPKFGPIQKPGEMFCSEGSLADNFINGLLGSKLAKRPNTNGDYCWGEKNKLAVHTATGMPVDLFATTKDNWWVSLVIRTGPKELNIELIRRARGRGLLLHAYGAFSDAATGAVIFPRSEEEVFELCGMNYLPPNKR